MQVRLPIDQRFDGEVIYHRAHQVPLVNAQTHRHDELELNVVVRGSGTCIIDGRKCPIGKNTCLWLFPDQEHMLIEQSPDFEMWICLFRPKVVERHKQYINNPVLNSKQHDGIFQRILNGNDMALLSNLCERMSDREDHYRFNQGVDWLFLETWKLFQESELIDSLPQVPECIEDAVRILQQEDCDLPKLAESCGVSPSWLSRSFSKHIGMSISAFRNRQRMDRFFKIYGNGNRENMTQAAFAAGFNSYAQFYKVCKFVCGKTPRDIARECKGDV